MNIFYIEDIEEIGEFVKSELEEYGHTVTWVNRRDLVPNDLSLYDLILSDYDVPNGTFLSTKRKAVKSNRPIVLASANDSAKNMNNIFVSKPFDIDYLNNIINETAILYKKGFV